MYKSFETERLFLIPTSYKDASLILELFNTEKWIKYIGDRNVKTIEDAKEYIKTKMQPQLEKYGYSNYTLIRKSDNEKVGVCGLYNREGLEGIDIGFALLPQYEKKGYAFESTNKLIKVGFEEFGISQISGITDKNNLASQKILKKAGLKYIGLMKLPDEDEEILLYRLNK